MKKACFGLLLLLAACEQATPYKKSSTGLGYWESWRSAESETFRVTFNGSHATTYETAQTYWLYRCAEIALEKGFNGFEVITDIQLVNNEDEYIPTDNNTNYYSVYPIIMPGAKSAIPVVINSGIMDQPKSISAEIRLIKYEFVAQPPKTFNAKHLIKQLNGLVKGKKCRRGNVCPHTKPYLSE